MFFFVSNSYFFLILFFFVTSSKCLRDSGVQKKFSFAFIKERIILNVYNGFSETGSLVLSGSK